jgi:hypothetical protein
MSLLDPNRKVTIDGYQPDAEDDPEAQGNQQPTIENPRAVAPDDAASAAADDAKAPEPITQAPEPVTQAPEPAAQDTLQPGDIAGKMVEANQDTGDYLTPAGGPVSGAAPALPADQDPDVLALMQARYHSDPAQVQRQLDAATYGTAMADPNAAPPVTGNLTPGTPGAPTMESILQNRLIELMGRGVTPSENDPEIAKTLQATRLAGQRAFDRNAADQAERMSYAGQSGSGAAEAGRAALRQAQGETEQNITAQVYQDAANRRIAELQQTLATAGNLLSEKDKNALQLQIASMQDATNRYGIATGDATDRYGISEGGRQFDVGLAEKIREYGLDAAARDAAQGAAGSAANAAAEQRRYEFDKNFGLDERQQGFLEDKWATSQNADPVLAFLRSNGYLE